MPNETCRFDQAVYGWSKATIFGRRGFGVVAASPGWLPLLAGNDDILGPVVAYPEPGRRGAAPPPHGGFMVLRGTPVVFRRLPSGTDALDRPGNFSVQVLIGHGFTIDGGMAAGLLASSWVDADLPTPASQELPLLELPKPGPRRGSAAADGAVCGAVLQGLRDDRRVVLAMPEEAHGRAALCDAVRRLPGDLGSSVTFSTLESEPERSGFDVAVAVAGWETNGSSPGRSLRVTADGTGLDARSLGWGRELATTSAASLRGIPAPITVAALGLRLEALSTLREDPRRLTPQALLSVLTSPDGQAWAAQPEAPAIAREIMSGMDPALAPRFAKAAQRRPAVTALLHEVGWASLAGTARGPAERMLLDMGESQSDIDMAVLAATPGDRLSAADSARYLRLLRERGGSITADPAGAKVAWNDRLAAENPHLWFEAVVGGVYRGPRASRAVVDGLNVAKVGLVLTQAYEAGLPQEDLARRIWAVLPSRNADRTALLRTIAASSDAGLGITFEHLLSQSSLDPAVRTTVLTEFWPVLVREYQLPSYLATELTPAHGVRLTNRGIAAAAVLMVALVLLAGYLGAQYFAPGA